MERIIDFGGWGFIERDLTPINRKIVLSKDYANKEPQVKTFKMDFSKKGELNDNAFIFPGIRSANCCTHLDVDDC